MLGKGVEEIHDSRSRDAGAACLGMPAAKAAKATGQLRGDPPQINLDPFAPPKGEIHELPFLVNMIADSDGGLADV